MENTKKLKEMGQRTFINDNVTPLRGMAMYLIRQKKEVESVTSVSEKNHVSELF